MQKMSKNIFPAFLILLLTILPVHNALCQTQQVQAVVDDWQNQFEAAAKVALIVQVKWSKHTPAAHSSETGTVSYASSPEGKEYLTIWNSTDRNKPSEADITAYDGKVATTAANATTFNLVNDPVQAKHRVPLAYEAVSGFCIKPKALLTSPLYHSETTPQKIAKRIIRVKPLPEGGMRLSFSRTQEDGYNVPTSLEFSRISDHFSPIHWVYRADENNQIEVIVERIVSLGNYVLPAQYRVINTTNVGNAKRQNLSSAATYHLQYRPVTDESIFSLKPTSKQFEIVENQGGETIVNQPGHSSILKQQGRPGMVTAFAVAAAMLFVVLGWSAWRYRGRRS